MDSETLDLVYIHYMPEQEIDEVEIDEVEIEEIDEIIEEETEEKIEEEIDNKEFEELPLLEKAEKIAADIPIAQDTIIEPKTGTVDDLENDNPDEIELIKVKKVKLDGIKVVGKIELPEKPKKEIIEPEIVEPESDQVKTEEKPKKGRKSINRKIDPGRRKNQRGRNRNPLTYDEKLKKEERESLRKRRQKNKEEKIRKRKYYQENIQPKTNPKAIRKKKKQTAIQTPGKTVVYKNPIKRLWAWLNGKYDSY